MIPELATKELPEDGTIFCEAGSNFALNLIRTTSKATEYFGIVELDVMKRTIDDAFEALRIHWLTCSSCNEEDDPAEQSGKSGSESA
jgi:hypothetical protein